MGSYAEGARYYDLLYAKIRDYAADTARLLEIFAAVRPPVKRVLDVACGTGRQAALLVERGLAVDGLDLEPAFVRIARQRVPSGHFVEGDMTRFDMAAPYDAVICLFGSIGYARTEPHLRSAIRCLADATREGGVVVLEPWFEPGAMTDGYLMMTTAQDEETAVCRMSRTVVRGRISRIEFDYLVGEQGEVRHFTEAHELGLFPRRMIEAACRAAGLAPTYDAHGLIGRGLYVARKVGAPPGTRLAAGLAPPIEPPP